MLNAGLFHAYQKVGRRISVLMQPSFLSRLGILAESLQVGNVVAEKMQLGQEQHVLQPACVLRT